MGLRWLPILPVPSCRLSSCADIQLTIDISKVGFYGVDGDVEGSRNLRIALSIGNQVYDLNFAARECC